MTPSGPSPDPLIAELVALTQRGDHSAVVAAWQRLDRSVQRQEVAVRIVAAALARLGNLARANTLLSEVFTRQAAIEPATYALSGRIAFDVGMYALSVDRLEHAVQARREPLWWLWLADSAIKAAQPKRALAFKAHVQELLLASPDFAIMYATLLTHDGQADEAKRVFERILVQWPRHDVAGPGYAEFVMREFPLEAAGLLATRPWQPPWTDLSPARVRAALWLPPFYENEESASFWRSRLLANLQELTEVARRSLLKGDTRAACLATTPFFAAFHDADVTAIQFAWGDFVEAVVAPLRGEIGLGIDKRTEDAPSIKTIGIVSNRITSSSAGRFFNSWIDDLAAAGFEIRLYAFGNTDAVTQHFARRYSLRHFPDDDTVHWRVAAAALTADANDALLFPEPQGSQLISLLAGLRLSPVQCASFGNPLTTGLLTMDYFLTPDLAEVADPARYYREQVVRLAGIGTRINDDLPGELPRVSKAELGLRESDNLYLVSQQLQKWSPAFVALLVRILRNDPDGRVAYFNIGGTVSARAFRAYLARALGNLGINAAERTRGLSLVDRPTFLAINRCADVALDTVSFGGGSTTHDALTVGLPVVSVCGGFLRSRQTSGMLRARGLQHLVATDSDDFVRLANKHSTLKGPQRSETGSKHHHVENNLPDVADSVAAFFKSLRDGTWSG